MGDRQDLLLKILNKMKNKAEQKYFIFLDNSVFLKSFTSKKHKKTKDHEFH